MNAAFASYCSDKQKIPQSPAINRRESPVGQKMRSEKMLMRINANGSIPQSEKRRHLDAAFPQQLTKLSDPLGCALHSRLAVSIRASHAFFVQASVVGRFVVAVSQRPSELRFLECLIVHLSASSA